MSERYRRALLKQMGAGGAFVTMVGSAQAKSQESALSCDEGSDKRFPSTREVAEPLKKLSNDIAFHPSQPRAAFASAAFDGGFNIYVAEDVESAEEVPSEVYLISDCPLGGAYGPEWERGNRLSYQRNLSRVEKKVTRSYKRLPHKTIEENVIDYEEMEVVDKRGEA